MVLQCIYVSIAQWTEQQFPKLKIAGSTPAGDAIERCASGLSGNPGKVVVPQGARGFESHLLCRRNKKTRARKLGAGPVMTEKGWN